MHCTCHILSSTALPLARRLRQALAAAPWRSPTGEALAECRLSAPQRFAPEDCRPFAGIMDTARQAAGSPQIFLGATGIAVRAVAPLLEHKSTDAPVLVISPDGRFVISLLAGHWGGGNSLCRHVAALLGAVPVITTATDCGGGPALDLFLQAAGLRILDWDQLPPAQACWLEGRPLPLWDPCGAVTDGDGGAFLRQEVLPEQDGPALCVHWQRLPVRQGRLRVALPALVLGLGCRKGIPAPLVATAVEGLLLRHGLEPQALAALATVTEKAREPALQELARRLGLPLLTFEAAELAAVTTPHPSPAAGERFGCAPFSVCEAACLLAARQLGATATMKTDGEGTLPARRGALEDGPPAGTGNGQQAEGRAGTAVRLLVEKNKVAGQLTLAVALSNTLLRRDDA
ncbi:cobalt-precorrin 5A hydrolase [uncultured Desulfovibrio sp.]|uniref:cobalt-precorrin 5A hydrolase n=1 Tax=uncultured Desulfovibrio sp. TaxID=167968 RepID=UPI00265D5791|nr:cobalamin biosynthesis protein [uncultured Desulfovibrio sp.]